MNNFYRVKYQVSSGEYGQFTTESAKQIIDWVASEHGGTLHIISVEKVKKLVFVDLIIEAKAEAEAEAEKNKMPEISNIKECVDEFFEYADSLGVGGLI